MREAVSYVRVSSRDQEREGFSIPAQKKLLLSYASKNGLTVVKIFEEVETAKRAGRKQFRKMLQFLRGSPDCKDILVEKTDRLYRNLRDYAELDPDELDVRIHFVKENVVLDRESKSNEKFVHGIKVLMAKQYSDNLSEEVKKGQTEKASQGIYPSWAPIGYINKLADHTIGPDPETAPLIRRAFEMAATGRFSLSKLSHTLHGAGLRGRRSGKSLTKQSMARLLRNPFYYGEYTWNGRVYQGTHQPLISKELFDRVQEAMGYAQKTKLTKHSFTFAGVLTCGHCGCAITAERKQKKSGRVYVYYHCTNGKGICKNVVYLREEVVVYLREEVIDEKLASALKHIRLTSEIVEWTREALLESLEDERELHRSATQNLSSRYQKLGRYISQAYEDKLEGRIEPELWEMKSTAWRREQDEILRQLEAHKAADTSYLGKGVRLMELANKASELFKEMTGDEKREIVNSVLSNPQVIDGSIRFSYKMPFAIFENVANLNNWRDRRDSNSRPPA